jgi:cell division protein FtsB
MLLKKLLYLGGLVFLFGILYTSVLGSHGILERKSLEKKLLSLQEEVDRLEVENYTLTQRDRYLASEEGALASESGKNYLISGESKIIKFKEVIEMEEDNQVLAAHVPLSHLTIKESKNQAVTLQFLKVFYLLGAGVIGIAVFFRMKKE